MQSRPCVYPFWAREGRWVGASRAGGVVNSFSFVCPAGRAYFCQTKVAKTRGISISPAPLKTTQGRCPWTPLHRKNTYITHLWVASSNCMAGRPTQKRLCSVASSIRAMPEKEKPPATRVDIYFYLKSFADLFHAVNIFERHASTFGDAINGVIGNVNFQSGFFCNQLIKTVD